MRKRIFEVLFLIAGVYSATLVQAQNTLDLDSCRSMAIRHNKSLAISDEKLQQAQQARKAAFTQFLPNFNASGAYLYNSRNISLLSEDALLPVGTKAADGSFTLRLDQMVTADFPDGNGGVITLPVDANGNPFNPLTNPERVQPKDYALLPKEAMEFDIENTFVAGIGFTQPIFMGGKILELYRIASLGEQLASLGYENSKINLLIQVDEAYWRAVSLQAKQKLALEYRALLQTTSENVATLFEQGFATKADVLKVKVKLNEAEMTLTKAENGLRLAKMMLNQICGMPLDTDYELSEVAKSDLSEVSLEDNIGKMTLMRPEAKMLDLKVALAESEVRIARSRFMPNIVASGNYLLSNPNVFNGFENKFDGFFSVGVGVTIPIFHWGERIHTLSVAKHAHNIAKMEREEALEKLELQANMMQFKRNEAFKQEILSQNNLENAQENLSHAQLSFEEGIISAADLMEAQTAWVSAKSDNIDAQINTMLSKLYLEQSLGKIKVK